MIEVQCTSCHTRYRVDEHVLPEGTPTFKCSRCGHVFSIEPRKSPASDDDRSAPTLAPRNRLKPPRQAAAPAPTPSADTADADAAKPPPSEPAPAPSVASRPADAPPLVEKPAPTNPAADKPGDRGAIEEALFGPSRKTADEADDEENFSFDFSQEDRPLDDQPLADDPPQPTPADVAPLAAADWKVGELPDAAAAPAADHFEIGAAPPAARRPPRKRVLEEPDLDEHDAPLYNRGVTHTSRFFLGLLVLVAILYAGVTYAIHNAPAAAFEALHELPGVGAEFDSAALPGRMVALNEVHAELVKRNDGRTALVIQGTAHNVSRTPLHQIAIAVRLRTASGQAVTRRQVFCGNNPDGKFVPQMTPHEIEFFQSRPAPNDFALAPARSCSFMAVFIDPPPATRFDLAVTEATPAAADLSSTNQ